MQAPRHSGGSHSRLQLPWPPPKAPPWPLPVSLSPWLLPLGRGESPASFRILEQGRTPWVVPSFCSSEALAAASQTSTTPHISMLHGSNVPRMQESPWHQSAHPLFLGSSISDSAPSLAPDSPTPPRLRPRAPPRLPPEAPELPLGRLRKLSSSSSPAPSPSSSHGRPSSSLCSGGDSRLQLPRWLFPSPDKLSTSGFPDSEPNSSALAVVPRTPRSGLCLCPLFWPTSMFLTPTPADRLTCLFLQAPRPASDSSAPLSLSLSLSLSLPHPRTGVESVDRPSPIFAPHGRPGAPARLRAGPSSPSASALGLSSLACLGPRPLPVGREESRASCQIRNRDGRFWFAPVPLPSSWLEPPVSIPTGPCSGLWSSSIADSTTSASSQLLPSSPSAASSLSQSPPPFLSPQLFTAKKLKGSASTPPSLLSAVPTNGRLPRPLLRLRQRNRVKSPSASGWLPCPLGLSSPHSRTRAELPSPILRPSQLAPRVRGSRGCVHGS